MACKSDTASLSAIPSRLTVALSMGLRLCVLCLQDDKGLWNQFGGRLSWDASAIVGDDSSFGGRGGVSSGVSFEAAPNLDHSQPFVKSGLTEWLCWLRDAVGFNGWRYLSPYPHNPPAGLWNRFDYRCTLFRLAVSRSEQAGYKISASKRKHSSGKNAVTCLLGE